MKRFSQQVVKVSRRHKLQAANDVRKSFNRMEMIIEKLDIQMWKETVSGRMGEKKLLNLQNRFHCNLVCSRMALKKSP